MYPHPSVVAGRTRQILAAQGGGEIRRRGTDSYLFQQPNAEAPAPPQSIAVLRVTSRFPDDNSRRATRQGGSNCSGARRRNPGKHGIPQCEPTNARRLLPCAVGRPAPPLRLDRRHK